MKLFLRNMPKCVVYTPVYVRKVDREPDVVTLVGAFLDTQVSNLKIIFKLSHSLSRKFITKLICKYVSILFLLFHYSALDLRGLKLFSCLPLEARSRDDANAILY